MKDFAGKKGCTPAQLALAWVLAQGEDVVPIPGTKRVRYLEDNMGAAAVRLDRHELNTIAERCADVGVVGERYTPEMMSLVHR